MLYVGEGPTGSNGTCSTLCRILITPCATHNQIGPLWCWFPSGWACAHPRPLWVSPTISPVRLGVSPAAVPTPTGFFTQSFAWVVWSASLPAICPVYLCANVGPRVLPATLSLVLSVYLCVNVGPQGLLVVKVPAPFVPHSTSLSPSTATRVLSTLVPVSAPPTGLDVCFKLPCHSIFCQFWLCEEA